MQLQLVQAFKPIDRSFIFKSAIHFGQDQPVFRFQPVRHKPSRAPRFVRIVSFLILELMILFPKDKQSDTDNLKAQFHRGQLKAQENGVWYQGKYYPPQSKIGALTVQGRGRLQWADGQSAVIEGQKLIFLDPNDKLIATPTP